MCSSIGVPRRRGWEEGRAHQPEGKEVPSRKDLHQTLKRGKLGLHTPTGERHTLHWLACGVLGWFSGLSPDFLLRWHTHQCPALCTPKALANNDKRKRRAVRVRGGGGAGEGRGGGAPGLAHTYPGGRGVALPQRPCTGAALRDVAAAVARARLGSGSTARSRSHRPPRILPPGGEAAAGAGEAGPARSLGLWGPQAPHAGKRRVP